jgi:glycosyltransferase involved in cell wall biosynthesis
MEWGATTISMNSHPSVSVIIATYHREDSLMDCLKSVMAQCYAGPMEIIVVEQGRQHPHAALDSFFSLHCRRITRIEQKEPNLPKARNAGSAAARNELLIFIDDDMALPPGAVARLARHVLPGSRCAVAGLPISDSAPEGSFADYARLYGNQIRNAASGLIAHSSYIPSPFCIPTELYLALGGFDENLGKLSPPAFGEDDEFWQWAGASGVKLFIDPSLRVEHRDHLAGGCGSRKADPEMALKYHMKSKAYIRIKRYGRLGAGGWLQLARGYLLNREVLRQGLRHPLQNFLTLRVAIREVKAFMAENCAKNSAPGPMSARSQEPGRIWTS